MLACYSVKTMNHFVSMGLFPSYESIQLSFAAGYNTTMAHWQLFQMTHWVIIINPIFHSQYWFNLPYFNPVNLIFSIVNSI